MQRSAADLDLETPVSLRDGVPDVIAQALDVIVRAIVAAAGVNVGGGVADVVRWLQLRQASPQRHIRALGGEIPQRRIDQADRATALAVAAGLFVFHQDRPDPERIDAAILAGIILRVGGQQTRDEAVIEQAAVVVAADRVEGEAGQRLTIAAGIGMDRKRGRRHVIEADTRASRRRAEPYCLRLGGDDAHQP